MRIKNVYGIQKITESNLLDTNQLINNQSAISF